MSIGGYIVPPPNYYGADAHGLGGLSQAPFKTKNSDRTERNVAVNLEQPLPGTDRQIKAVKEFPKRMKACVTAVWTF